MKLTLERDALHAALGRVAKAVGKGSNLPILGNVLLEAADGGLTVAGCDLDLEARETIGATVTTPGALTVPASMLQAIVARSASGAQMRFENIEDGMPVSIAVGRSRISLQTLPAMDFPKTEFSDRTTTFVVDGKAFARLLGRVSFAISNEETRHYLCGIYLHCVDVDGAPTLRAVATDGHRLARADLAAPAGAELMRGVIIPTKAANEIIRLGKDAAGDTVVEVNDRQIRVAFQNGATLVAKLVDGTFPDYARLIRDSSARNILADRDGVVQALNRVAAVAGDASIMMSLSNDTLRLSTKNPNAGEAVDELEIDYQGDDLEIRFASKYLRDILSTIEGDQFRGGFESPGAPAVFEAKGRDGLLVILMPRSV